MNWNDLDRLNELRQKGAITEEEYLRAKNKVFSAYGVSEQRSELGLSENTYCALMHAALLLPAFGFIVSLVLWASGKDRSKRIEIEGRYIIDFVLSTWIYTLLAVPLVFIGIGIIMYVVLGIVRFLYPIIGLIQALSGTMWSYPGSLPLFRR